MCKALARSLKLYLDKTFTKRKKIKLEINKVLLK